MHAPGLTGRRTPKSLLPASGGRDGAVDRQHPAGGDRHHEGHSRLAVASSRSDVPRRADRDHAAEVAFDPAGPVKPVPDQFGSELFGCRWDQKRRPIRAAAVGGNAAILLALRPRHISQTPCYTSASSVSAPLISSMVLVASRRRWEPRPTGCSSVRPNLLCDLDSGHKGEKDVATAAASPELRLHHPLSSKPKLLNTAVS